MNKKALIKALLKGEELNKESYIFSWEYHKVTDKVGFFKLEVLDASEKVILKFKVQLDPSKPDNQPNFAALKDGEESINVGLFQLESKSFLSKLKEGMNLSIKEGRVPFLSGFFK